MGRGGAAAKMDGTIYAHMPRCCTSAHEEPTIPTILHRQPSPPLVLMCHRTLLRPAAVLDVPVRDQAAPHCEAIARVNWGTRAAGTDADVPEPQRIPAQGPAHRRRHVVPCESLGAIVLEQHWGIAKSGYALRVRWSRLTMTTQRIAAHMDRDGTVTQQSHRKQAVLSRISQSRVQSNRSRDQLEPATRVHHRTTLLIHQHITR